MPIYTKDKLNQDILDGVVEYVANFACDIKQKEIDYINSSDYKWIYDEQISLLSLDLNKAIYPLDAYYPNHAKKPNESSKAWFKKIPYAFIDIDIDIEEIEKQQKHRTKGFPNLRVMIDCRKPYEDPTEYDFMLMCYHYDHRLFWVKDGDFIDGLYEIINPKEMLDEYFLHVFSQVGEDYSRFDFSPWAKKI